MCHLAGKYFTREMMVAFARRGGFWIGGGLESCEIHEEGYTLLGSRSALGAD